MYYILPPLLFGLRPVFTFALFLPLYLPLSKRSLALVALKIGLHIREQAAGKGF